MSEEIRKLFPEYMKYIDALPIANYIEQLQQENQQLKEQLLQREIIIECLYHGVVMNEEQEELLDKILFNDKYKGDRK